MTLILGIVADDGLVVASDSQMSLGSTRRDEQKVWAANDERFIFALAGSETTTQRLRDALLPLQISGQTAGVIGVRLQETFTAVLQVEYDRARSLGGVQQALPTAEGIVACYADGSAHLFHVDALASITEHRRGVVTGGSGGPLGEIALAIFEHLRGSALSMHRAKMLGYRTIQDAVKIAGPDIAIGGAIQMASLSINSGRAQLHERDDPEIDEAVFAWREYETTYFAEHAPPGEPEEASRPED